MCKVVQAQQRSALVIGKRGTNLFTLNPYLWAGSCNLLLVIASTFFDSQNITGPQQQLEVTHIAVAPLYSLSVQTTIKTIQLL